MNYLDDLAREIYFIAEGESAIAAEDWPLYRGYAVLALAKGEQATAKDVHDAWVAWANTYRPGHRSAVPFEALTVAVQALDQPYVDAIHAVTRLLIGVESHA